jgi:hypothetical protein
MRRIRSRVATADHHNVELFHVKHPSLAKAEAGEYFAKDSLYIDASYQRIESANSGMDIRSGEICRRLAKIKVTLRTPERLDGLTHGGPVTHARRQTN